MNEVVDDALQNPHDGGKGSTWRVHNLLTALEFEFEAWLSMSCRGLFLTYAIPSVSSVLVKAGGFNKDIQRRYADMELLIREFNENAVDGTVDFNGQPERAKQSLYRINAIHQQYKSLIKYDDMIYVWSVFAVTPARWMESRWSWRHLTNDEKSAIYHHWINIGKYMNLSVDKQFPNWESIRTWKLAYEKANMRFCQSNVEVSGSTVDYFMDGVVRYPMLIWMFRPVVMQLMSCLQDDPSHAAALGLPKANPFLSGFLDLVLTTRALVVRWLLPPKPFSWQDRLTGTLGTPFQMDLTATSSRHYSPNISGSESGSRCPMTKILYWPARALDFSNSTYHPTNSTTSDGMGAEVPQEGYYAIEDMGPRHVEKGTLCEKPIYVGHPGPTTAE